MIKRKEKGQFQFSTKTQPTLNLVIKQPSSSSPIPHLKNIQILKVLNRNHHIFIFNITQIHLTSYLHVMYIWVTYLDPKWALPIDKTQSAMKPFAPTYSSPAHKTTNLPLARSSRCIEKAPSSVDICSKTPPSFGKTSPSYLSLQPCSPQSNVFEVGIRPSPNSPPGIDMAASPLSCRLFYIFDNPVMVSLDMMHHQGLPLRQPTPETNASTRKIWTPVDEECE